MGSEGSGKYRFLSWVTLWILGALLEKERLPPLPLLSSCGWTHNKIAVRQINRRR